MARNEEKAQSMLNRFIALKAEEKKKPKERRPYLASKCRDLAEASRWRQQIMGEIGRKVTEIQNEALGEHRTRDLNDEINKLIREKPHPHFKSPVIYDKNKMSRFGILKKNDVNADDIIWVDSPDTFYFHLPTRSTSTSGTRGRSPSPLRSW
ncbi:hypothetical protein ACFX1R_031722 [Malus domestica]|nr:pre-mRNA-splicing factor ISY1 homolog [Malus domestica]